MIAQSGFVLTTEPLKLNQQAGVRPQAFAPEARAQGGIDFLVGAGCPALSTIAWKITDAQLNDGGTVARNGAGK